jgi:hypothetical protein
MEIRACRLVPFVRISAMEVVADDEAGHDIDDVEMGFVVCNELLGCVEGVGFGCCVSFE